MNSSTFNGFAGQRLDLEQTDIEAQLHAFIERRRSNPIMRNVAHVLSPSMVTALAQHFYNLNPPPLGGAPRGSIAAGKKIYEEGLPQIQRSRLFRLLLRLLTSDEQRDGRPRPEPSDWAVRSACQRPPVVGLALSFWRRGQCPSFRESA